MLTKVRIQRRGVMDVDLCTMRVFYSGADSVIHQSFYIYVPSFAKVMQIVATRKMYFGLTSTRVVKRVKKILLINSAAAFTVTASAALLFVKPKSVIVRGRKDE